MDGLLTAYDVIIAAITQPISNGLGYVVLYRKKANKMTVCSGFFVGRVLEISS